MSLTRKGLNEMSEMSAHTDVDVVIVGYGPVGQYLSYKLARAGWTSACIERFPQAYAFPRAVHFDDEIARLFQSVGLDPETNPAIQQFDQPYRWVNADREILLEIEGPRRGRPGGRCTTSSTSPTSSGRSTPSSSRSRGPRCSAAGRRSRSSRTTTARPCSPGAFEAGPDAETRTFRGRYVIGADGANSFVRSRMDVTTTDLGFEFDWLIVDLLLDEPLEVEQRAWQWCRPERPTSVMPGGAPHRQRWEFMRLPGETIEELNTEERRGAWSASSG